MKRTSLILLCILISVTSISADAYFNGENTLSLVTGFGDAAFTIEDNIIPSNSTSFTVETDNLSFWTSLAIQETGSTFSLNRLSYQWNLGDHTQLTIGRQGLLTGYGYGWNPIDLFSGSKDPSDPEADRMGVDAMTMLYDDWDSFIGKAVILLDSDFLRETPVWSDISIGAETTLLLDSSEIKLTALADLPGTGEDFSFTAGLGTYFDIAGAGVYAEVNTDLDILAGVEYFFENGMSMIVEYLYHHEGFNLSERQTYFAQVFVDPTLPSSFVPGYFAQHYILGNLSHSFYELNTDVNLSVLYSPDSYSLMAAPLVTFYTNSGFTLSGGYIGIFSLKEHQSSEADLSPFSHAIQIGCSYAF